MSMIRSLVRASAAFALAGVALSCDHNAEVFMPEPADDIFRSYVAIGNSITAGVQSDGINDSTQQRSYAVLLARQMRTRFAYPSLVMPGCRPPLSSFQTGARVGTGSTSTTCLLRNPALATDILNNVAVPEHLAGDATADVPNNPNNPLTTLFLGGKTQVQRALEARPTFATVWLGNNEVFQAAYTGLTTPVPGVSRGIIPLATFTANYDRLMTQLTDGAPGVKGALVGVLQVAGTPILFPAAALADAQFLGGLSQVAGGPITVLPNCTGSPSLVSLIIALEMRAGRHIRTISCDKSPDPTELLGNIWIVDAQEQGELSAAVTAYNAYLQQKANGSDFAYVDLNPLIGPLRASGAISTVPNLASATPFGTHFSLDGLHPGTLLHVVFANSIISAINAKYATSLPAVP
jgi:hypothetical protein